MCSLQKYKFKLAENFFRQEAVTEFQILVAVVVLGSSLSTTTIILTKNV